MLQSCCGTDSCMREGGKLAQDSRWPHITPHMSVTPVNNSLVPKPLWTHGSSRMRPAERLHDADTVGTTSSGAAPGARPHGRPRSAGARRSARPRPMRQRAPHWPAHRPPAPAPVRTADFNHHSSTSRTAIGKQRQARPSAAQLAVHTEARLTEHTRACTVVRPRARQHADTTCTAHRARAVRKADATPSQRCTDGKPAQRTHCQRLLGKEGTR